MIIKIGELYDLSCKFLNIQGEYEKEIDVKNLGITVDCPDGITNVNYIIKKKTEGLKLYFDNDNYLICANKHILYQDEKEIKAYDLKIGDYITTKNGNIKIINIEKSNIEDYYDISVDYPYVYYDANGIKHHNTLISAALAKLCQPFGKVILVVPSQDLCIQSADEFKLLGLDTGIVGCGLREFNHNIIVCTWQTINSLERRTKGSKKVKENPLSAEELKTLKSGVVALIFDECHQSKSTEIQKVITETFKDVPIKWGLTGTIPKEKSEYYCLLTSLGDKAVSVKSHELQEKGFMASCNINCIRLMDDAVFMDYEDEVNYLSTDDKRLSYIANLIKGIADTGNTLVLLNRIVTGEILERKLNDLGADVVFLQGSISIKKRKEQYKEVNEVDNKCILATAQIASTGINIPRLFNLVILDFGKSFTRSIQSIGRVLRLAKDKTSANVFDISSILKYSRRHFNERIKYYDDEQHPYHIYKIDNWKNNS